MRLIANAGKSGDVMSALQSGFRTPQSTFAEDNHAFRKEVD